MYEIDQVYQEKFVKFDVSLLIELSQNKEINIDPFDFKVVFGDENLLGSLSVWESLFTAFPVAYTQFINTHPDRDFEITNPMVVRLTGHFEISRYRAVFEIYLDEETGINDDLTDDDKAILLRTFYEFDDNIRRKNGLRLTPVEEKQKLYDQHFDVDKMPYMIADNVPNWEDRPKDPHIELVDITEEMKAERKALRELKRIYFPTPYDLAVARKKAENKLIMYEEKYPQLDLKNQFVDQFDPYMYDFKREEVEEIVQQVNRN